MDSGGGGKLGAPDQPSAVYSPEQPLAVNTDGSVLSVNTTQVCRHCPAAFVLDSSLELHLAACHGETLPSTESTEFLLPVSSAGCVWDQKNTDKMNQAPGTLPTKMTDHVRKDSGEAAVDFVLKLEPPWSQNEDSPDQRLAVYSPVQPLCNNISGPLLSLNTTHMCQHCSAAFVLLSSFELHLACFHGEQLHTVLPVFSTPDSCDAGNYGNLMVEKEGVGHGNKKMLRRKKDKTEGNDAGEKGGEKKSRCHVCDVCSKSFLWASTFKRHKLTHMTHKPFMCDVCSKTFTEAGTLKRHKLTHTGQKPFVCDVCTKTFSEAGTLKRHKLIHTGLKPFVCDVCSKSFVLNGDLKTHKMIHTGHRPFVCDVCSKAFTQSGDLNKHKRIHTGERPYKCPHCDTDFTRLGNLQSHVKSVHAGDRPYVCDFCGAAFSRTGDLATHRRIHTGEKPYVCTDCGKGFAQSGNLKYHRLIHTGEKPYTCPHCPSAFIRAHHLKRHVQNLHQLVVTLYPMEQETTLCLPPD